ncbi:AraC family transcriptional regulator [Flagellimonas sp. S3867]|uniref:helix-turn-helix domain-containing protein n=1 Tax=Flagellimonas sp. S3867 TaxID=2768063 RepID=UPI001CC2362B|nr:AraC family transcriptional regulator [Flagellimonas sp. S3867]
MIVDIQQYFRRHSRYNKLVGDDYLFVEYKCPIDVENFQLFTDSHIINYVISGRKDWFSPDQTFEIQGGDALFVRKGVYTTRQHFEVDYCVMLFFINDTFINNFFREHPSLKIPAKQKDYDQIFEIDINDSFESLIHSIFNYFKQAGEIPKSLVEIKFRELLFNILLNPKNQMLVEYLYSLSNSEKADMEYIMLKHFQYDLGLDEFAKLCGRSLSTFKRDFKNHFKQTPGNWIKNKRLECAKTLLHQSTLSINEICYESGFKNPSHFNKAFKEKYHLPPQQFRSSLP